MKCNCLPPTAERQGLLLADPNGGDKVGDLKLPMELEILERLKTLVGQ